MKQLNLFFVFFIALTFFSCRSERNKNPNILNIYLSADPVSMDPRVGGTSLNQIVIGSLYDGLMRLDREGNFGPGVAEKYEMTEDYLSCTFYLRKTIWSNGDPVTAHDFVNTWREALSPKFDTNHAFAFYSIKNAQAAREGKISLDKIGIRAIDDLTLVVDFEYPAPFFIELVSNPLYAPVHMGKSSKELVSNGPFILKEWKRNDFVLMEKNEKYWDAKSVNIDGIYAAIIVDANTALMMYEAGKLDIYGNPLSEIPLDVTTYLKREKTLHYFPANTVSWLSFNTEQIPFNSKKVRQAFSYAINREKIVNQLLQRGDIVSTSILPENLHLQKEPYFIDGNVKEARRLFKEGLQELGMTKETMPKIEFQFVPRWNAKTIAQAIQDQWRAAFDIVVELRMTEHSIYAIDDQQFRIAFCGWDSWINDPSYNLGHVKTKNYLNISHWENRKYQELIDLAEKEKNPNQRREYYHQAEIVLMEEMPIAPLYTWVSAYTVREGVEGICIGKDSRIDFKWVTKNREMLVKK